MKKFFILFLGSAIMFSACNQEGSSNEGGDDAANNDTNTENTDVNNPTTLDESANIDPATLPVLAFQEEEFNWGETMQGDIVEHTFKFTNTGQSDLVISNAKASCGCTVPYWPKHPIKPGETEEIKVSFDSKGKSGKQRKSITVTSNTQPSTKVIYITGEVKAPDSPEAGS